MIMKIFHWPLKLEEKNKKDILEELASQKSVIILPSYKREKLQDLILP